MPCLAITIAVAAKPGVAMRTESELAVWTDRRAVSSNEPNSERGRSIRVGFLERSRFEAWEKGRFPERTQFIVTAGAPVVSPNEPNSGVAQGALVPNEAKSKRRLSIWLFPRTNPIRSSRRRSFLQTNPISSAGVRSSRFPERSQFRGCFKRGILHQTQPLTGRYGAFPRTKPMSECRDGSPKRSLFADGP